MTGVKIVIPGGISGTILQANMKSTSLSFIKVLSAF